VSAAVSPAATRPRRAALALACLAGLLAFTVQMIWVREYRGASVPFGDEWKGLVDFLADVREGQLSWHLMFAAHNEHRIPVARLFFLITYWVFGEASFLACQLISAALMGAIAALWTYTLRRLGEPLWLAAATLFVILSPSQYHNILWGFQVEFYTLVGAVVAAICWIALAPRVTWRGIAGCAAACAVSQYSIISGILSWGAVGGALFLRAVAEHRTVRALLGARREWVQMGLFVALGLAVNGVYFYGYDPQFAQGGAPRSAWRFMTWLSAAIVYPIVDIGARAEVWWLPAVVAAVFVPIAAALWLYWGQRDRARLVLVGGLVLNVVLNMSVIAAGRAAAPFVAPRYGTVALWSSAASLIAIASLLRASARTRWRWGVTPVLVALTGYLLCVHAWRYRTYPAEMDLWRRNFIVFEQNIRAYVTDGAPDRTLKGGLPFPAFVIAPFMKDPAFMAVMPYNLRPPARFTATSDAWALDRLPPALPSPREAFVFGSGTGTDAGLGTLTSTEMPARRSLLLRVAGYPSRDGGSLVIESATDPRRRIAFPGPDPGLTWADWRVDLSPVSGSSVRLVAADASPAPDGWLAVALPMDKPPAVSRLESFVAHLEWWTAGPAVALAAASFVFSRRRDPPVTIP
jgi:hypothetical protein